MVWRRHCTLPLKAAFARCMLVRSCLAVVAAVRPRALGRQGEEAAVVMQVMGVISRVAVAGKTVVEVMPVVWVVRAAEGA